jgi:hypothetical protein
MNFLRKRLENKFYEELEKGKQYVKRNLSSEDLKTLSDSKVFEGDSVDKIIENLVMTFVSGGKKYADMRFKFNNDNARELAYTVKLMLANIRNEN